MNDILEAYRVNDGTPILPQRRAEPAAPAPSTRDVFGAARRVALVDNSDWQDRLDEQEYGPIVEAINGYRTKRGLKGAFLTPDKRIRGGVDTTAANNAYGAAARLKASRDEVEAGIWAELDRIRSEQPDFLKDGPKNREAFWQSRYAREAAKRRDDQSVIARSGGFVAGAAQFAGGFAGALEDPYTIMTLPVGGMGRTAAMRIASAAAANAGVEAVLQPQVARNRAKIGEELSGDEMLRNVGFAGVAGGAFQGVGEAAGFLLKKVLGGTASPDERAALHVLEREQSIDRVNPYEAGPQGETAHRSKIADAQMALVHPETARARGGNPDATVMADFMRSIRRAESPSDTARNPNSSAEGRYQFTDGTWLTYYKRRYGAGLSDAAILAKKTDGRQQDVLMYDLMRDNVRALGRAGLPVTKGNMYVLHFAGETAGAKLLRADPDAPIAAVLGQKVVSANGFLRGMTAREGVNELYRRVGDGSAPSAAPPIGSVLDDIDQAPLAPLVRPEALDAVRPIVTAGQRSLDIASFAPEYIGVDAALMQFKSGGDASGVTDRLQGVQEWDPLAAGTVTVWEGSDGRRLIADGHQRLGLATRIKGAQPDADIRLNAFVLRESDGISASTARLVTARKNIGEGTGTIIDAAKVLREAGGEADAILRTLPPRSALVRDGRDLMRLSYDAFGAVINEVIPAEFGAVIGRYAPDQASQGALVDLLAKLQPANRKQAESVVRQAVATGFVRETQDELFGARELTSALFLQRAKILDKTLGELRKLKSAFGVAARNADALEGAGNVIAVDASEAAARANADALGIVEKLAYSKGNVSDILNSAAERLAKGEPLSRVVADVVASIRQLDLDALTRGSDADSVAGGSTGRSRFDEFDDDAYARAGSPDELSPSDFDDAVAAGLTALFDEPALARFDDPQGDAPKMVFNSVDHDLRAQGLHESDALFDLGDGVPRSGRDIFDELDGLGADIDTIRSCL